MSAGQRSKTASPGKDLLLKADIEIRITKAQVLNSGIRPYRGIEVYRVLGYSLNIPPTPNPGPQVDYVLACPYTAPDVGKLYFAHDEYVAPDLSLLHLSPVDRKSLGVDGKGKMYHVVQISNVIPGKTPDIACDVYSASAATGE